MHITGTIQGVTIKYPWLHKFPDLSLTLCLFPDLCRIPRHFQVSRNSRKVVTRFSAMLMHTVNICAKSYWNPSAKQRDNESHLTGVNGQTDERFKNTTPLLRIIINNGDIITCPTHSCRGHDDVDENYSSLPAVLTPADGWGVSCGQYCRFGTRGRTMVWFCGSGSFYTQQDGLTSLTLWTCYSATTLMTNIFPL